MRCYACMKELNKKEMLFTADRKGYCANPLDCGHPEHPNSVENILERQGAISLYKDTELEEIIFKNMKVSPDIKDRISKVATKPQSIRIQKTDLAYYLIKLQEVKDFSSISESVRFCIEMTMKSMPIEAIEEITLGSDEIKIEPVKEPAKYVKKTGVVIIPKAEPEQKEEIEEKFVF